MDALIELWSDPSIPPVWKKEKNVEAEVLRLHHANREWIFLKPTTFMNDTGRSVASACKWFLQRDPHGSQDELYPEVIVMHDDLDLELGRHKLQFASGPKVHNGVTSVRQSLNTHQFWTARLGIDDRGGDRSLPGKAYVLQPLTTDNLATLRSLAPVLAEEFLYTVLQ
jgi:peptidyl-tRNA hydrolase